MVKISIIMPCYNTEKYVGEALDSILCQNFSDIEIICIDDGSADQTLEVLRDYERQFDNILVFSGNNHGQGYQRNFGMEKATGKYIYFMDSDDKLVNGSLSRMYEYAEQNSLDILYFEGSSFFETKKLERDFPQYKTLYHRRDQFQGVLSGETLYLKFEESGQFIVQPCLQFTRYEHVKKNKLEFPCISALEDNLFALKSILAAERVACIPDSLYLRRVRQNSIMTAPMKTERLDDYWSVTLELMKILKQYREKPETEKAIYKRILRFMGNIDKTYQILKEESADYNSNIVFTENQIFLYMSQYCLRIGNRIHQTEENSIQKKLKEACIENARLKEELKQTCAEKSEINARLRQIYSDQSKINVDLKENEKR